MDKQQKGENVADIISLFFTLGCMQLGQDYSASESFPDSRVILHDLEQYGFIYRRTSDRGRQADQFFPTHLATSLCSGDSKASRSQSADDKRFLILETNYKIYAYTSNELEIAILNLFVKIRIRYPNLVVGILDRAPVKAAMDKGISAYQIISYLSSHAHPQMYNHPPPLLHPSVTDQLHLWDRERNRLSAQESEFTFDAVLTLQVFASSFDQKNCTRTPKQKQSETLASFSQYRKRCSSSSTQQSAKQSKTSSRAAKSSSVADRLIPCCIPCISRPTSLAQVDSSLRSPTSCRHAHLFD